VPLFALQQLLLTGSRRPPDLYHSKLTRLTNRARRPPQVQVEGPGTTALLEQLAALASLGANMLIKRSSRNEPANRVERFPSRDWRARMRAKSSIKQLMLLILS